MNRKTKAILSAVLILGSLLVFGMTFASRTIDGKKIASDLRSANSVANSRTRYGGGGGIFGNERAKIFENKREMYVRLWIACAVAGASGIAFGLWALNSKEGKVPDLPRPPAKT